MNWRRGYPALILILLCASFGRSGFAQNIPPENTGLRQLLETPELRSAHVGVYVYDDSSKKTIADFESDKYFIPASNTKLFTLYAGMKYLGDSLEGIRYEITDTGILITPTGDPSFLHPDFSSQPVFDFLKKTNKKIYIIDGGWKATPLGYGWSWNDYNEDYSAERSQFPVYGNIIRWTRQQSAGREHSAFEPGATVFSSPEIPWTVRFSTDSFPKTFLVQRAIDSNVFTIRAGINKEVQQDVPFVTNNLQAALELLPDTLGKSVSVLHWRNLNLEEDFPEPLPAVRPKDGWKISDPRILYSRPVDSVFIPMMSRSDNFYAEQTLLMVSNYLKGYQNDEKIIEKILADDLADLPQKPNWVDGSGLSRYNLFSPRDFVMLLIKCRNEFGMERMKRVLPTGGAGTLKNRYRSDVGYLFAKTGSMSGVVSLSGYVYTEKKHLLEFSILVNNNPGGASAIRNAFENYIEYLRRNN